MNAVYEKGACPHYLCAEPSTFLDCLKNFPTSLAEVTVTCTRGAPPPP